MSNNDQKLSFSAVEQTLFEGLYCKPDNASLEQIKINEIAVDQDNTITQRVKKRLKKNKLIYGLWLKYKEKHRGKVGQVSLKLRLKMFLKKFKVFRYISNRLRMPGRISQNNEMINTLLHITTATSQKCDAICWMTEDYRKHLEILEKATKDLYQTNKEFCALLSEHIGRLDSLDGKHEELIKRINVKMDENSIRLDRFLTDIHEKLDNDEKKVENLLTGIHEKLDNNESRVESLLTGIHEKQDNNECQIESLLTGIHEKLDNGEGRVESLLTDLHEKQDSNGCQIERLLTGVHEKLDSANISIANYNSKLNTCKTVISTDKVICVQYDWNLYLGVPSSDWRLAMYLSQGGHFEYGTEKLFRETIKPGMRILDIGANVGIYTLHGLKCGATVFSFEPTPKTFSVLRQNVALNGFENSSNSICYNVAVSDRAGTVKFTEVDGVCGQNNMFSKDEESTFFNAQTVKLDDLLKGQVIDCFKLDIEGAEMLALKGMNKLITNNPNIIGFIEFAPSNLYRANVDPETLFNYIIELGFEDIEQIDEETGETTKVKSYTDIKDVVSINLLLKKH